MKKKYLEREALYINLLTDFGFHKIFGTEANKDLLIDFLNQIIKEEGLIVDIKIQPSEQWGNYKTDRKAVFDIFCKTEKGEHFIVEMQKAKQTYFADRCLFYASLPIMKQAPKGKWDFNLNRVYLVAILDFEFFEEFESDKYQVLEHAYLMRESTKTAFSKKLKFAFVELPKFKKKESELETHFERWLYVLKNMSNFKNRPTFAQGEIFDKVFELAEIKRLTKTDMANYKKSVMEYHDVRDCMECARNEGRVEGREEGIMIGVEKVREEVIQKFFQKNVAIEDIVFFTGYTEEQILRLRKN